MKHRIASLGFAAAVAVLLSVAADAQNWTPEQQEVWKVEEQQWKMNRDKDLTWVESMVHPNLSYWETGMPMPQTRASLERWQRFSSASNTTLEQELLPISIVITSNVAVVHYYYSSSIENYKKERRPVTGHYTDVLLKEDGHWKFLAWVGGDDPEED
jgi:hypothetical protein